MEYGVAALVLIDAYAKGGKGAAAAALARLRAEKLSTPPGGDPSAR